MVTIKSNTVGNAKPLSSTPGGTPTSVTHQSSTPSDGTPTGTTPKAATPLSSTPANTTLRTQASTPSGGTPTGTTPKATTPLSLNGLSIKTTALPHSFLGTSTTLSTALNTGPKTDTLSLKNNLFTDSLSTPSSNLTPAAYKTANAMELKTGGVPASNLAANTIFVNPLASTPGGTPATTPGGSPTGTPTGKAPDILFIEFGGAHLKETQRVANFYAPDASQSFYDLTPDVQEESAPSSVALKMVKNADLPEPGKPSFFTITSKPSGDPNNPTGIDEVIDSFSQSPAQFAAILADANAKNPNSKVLNMSIGVSKEDLYDSLYSGITENPDMTPADVQTLAAQLKVPATTIDSVRTEFSGWNTGGPNSDPDYSKFKALSKSAASVELQNAITSYVDPVMDAPNSTFNKSLALYQTETKSLADKGVTVVPSFGNSRNFARYTYSGFDQGAGDKEVNFLAMSDSVVSVAASTDNSATGTVASFSSRGGGKWNPTLSADGTNVLGDDWSGTSFSAPTVSAIVADMEGQNPNLTFDQIKNKLTSTAYKGGSPTDLGAGILNIPGALENTGTPGGTPGGTPAGLQITADQAKYLRPVEHNFKKVAIADGDINGITNADLQQVATNNPQRPTLTWAAGELMKDTALLQQLNEMDGNATNGFTYQEIVSLLSGIPGMQL